MFSVIFVEPESSGNIGSLARVMRNFGLENLILVKPKCEINGETRAMATNAFDVVEKARVVKSFKQISKEFDFIVGTTGRTNPHYDGIRAYITPRELNKAIKTSGKIALVFGRESAGLGNDELSLCDVVVSIRTNPKSPVLNITHAAAIIFYELFAKQESSIMMADKKQKELLMRKFEESIKDTESAKDRKFLVKAFRNVIGRAFIADREAQALTGAFEKIRKSKVYK